MRYALATFILSVTSVTFAESATEMRYSGTLRQNSRDAKDIPIKTFDVYIISIPYEDGGHDIGFLVNERGGGGWSWPERFGLINLDSNHQRQNQAAIRLLHTHDDSEYPLALRQPLFEFMKNLKEGAEWTADGYKYQVRGRKKINKRDCWQVEATADFGRRQRISIDVETGVVARVEQRLFMGQGDEFRLDFQLESVKKISAKELTRVRVPFDTLIRLQGQLNRKENQTTKELTAEQLKAVDRVIAKLEKQADGTPFSRLTTLIGRDVRSQGERVSDIASLMKKYVGRPAPAFSLQTIGRKTVDNKQFAGKVTILHFWGYKNKPLTEPYGQIGYLDFLLNRHRKDGVQVVGIAINSLLEEPATAKVAVRSARKLKEFMNLSYPIAVGNTQILRKFGDPRTLGAKLPLWIVIGPDEKIAHYHVGFYKINPDQGLKQLDEVVKRLSD